MIDFDDIDDVLDYEDVSEDYTDKVCDHEKHVEGALWASNK